MHAALLMVLTASAEPTTEAPPDGAEAIHRALSARDQSPPCEDVEALSTAPVEALLYIVEHATQPPWAGMRAAECLTLRHAEAIQPQLTGWVQNPDTRGLALMVFNRLDEIPSTVALPVARASLNGPLAEDARSRFQKLENAEIKAILEESIPTP